MINRMIATKILGWKPKKVKYPTGQIREHWIYPDGTRSKIPGLPNFSKSMSAVWILVEKCISKGWEVEITIDKNGPIVWIAGRTAAGHACRGRGETTPLAIIDAAIQAFGVDHVS